MATVPSSQTRLIYGLIRDGKLADAVGRLQAVLRVAPESRAALSLLAHCYYQQEEFEAAAQMYEALAQRFPAVPEYQLYWAQSLFKAGLFAEAGRAAAGVEGLPQAVRQLQCVIRLEAGDLRGCRAALETLGPADSAAAVNAGCLLAREGRHAAAAAQFAEAAHMVGQSAELAYATAVCQYHQGDYPAALASLAEIVEHGVQQHPELGIGTQTEGMEARSVGNSAKLKHTALVEAFNLRAAVELQLGNPAGAAAALSDMPPRQEHELDPVTLHNQALVSLAGGGQQGQAAGMDRLRHLLAHPPFPPELAGNLLSLCCRPSGGAGISGSNGGGCGGCGLASVTERAAVVEQLLQEHGALVAAQVPADLLPLYEACAAGAHSAEEAHAKLDALAGVHIEGLRRRVKTVQDARWAGDQAAAATGLKEYEAAVEAYVPVLMSLAHLHWEAGAYGRVQEVLHQSAEFCSDHPAWRLNLAHALVAQEGAAAAGGAAAGSQGRLGQAAELYESLLQHFAGGEGGSLLEAPPSAVANLCECYVVGAQNEVTEDLLRRLEDEVAAAQAAGQPPPPHLSLTNLALGTLYCAKGNYEFGLTRVMRSLEPLAAHLDAPRWQGVMLCLLGMLDQAAKNMLVLKDALVADLLSFLEDVEAAGKGLPAVAVAPGSSGGSGGGGGQSHQQQPTVCSQARSLRAMLLKMND